MFVCLGVWGVRLHDANSSYVVIVLEHCSRVELSIYCSKIVCSEGDRDTDARLFTCSVRMSMRVCLHLSFSKN